jgi:hypothetical protein
MPFVCQSGASEGLMDTAVQGTADKEEACVSAASTREPTVPGR